MINNIQCNALLDSGNLWRCCLSKKMLDSLGLTTADLRPLKGISSVGTAKAGASLKVLGELSKPIALRFGGLSTAFKCRPVVLDGLAMPFNISGPFLKQHNFDQIHSRDALRVQGRDIPLVASVEPPCKEETIKSEVYCASTVIVPPNHLSYIPVRAPEVESRKMPSGDGILSGDGDFMSKTDLHPWAHTLISMPESGQLHVGVMNTLGTEVTIPEGTRYGCFRLTVSPEQQHQFPWRICTLQSNSPVSSSSNSGSSDGSQNASKRVPPSSPVKPSSFMGGPTTDLNKKDRLLFLVEKFQLDKSPFLTKKEDLLKAGKLLLDYWDLFSFDGSFGKTTLLKHAIRTDPNKNPINQRFRPVNPSLEKDLKEQLDKWLLHDVIEPSSSPWNFGLVAAPKKNGKIRWCVDYRQLNNITQKDSHPIGCISDNLSRLSRSKIFSGIDGTGAFHVIEIEEQDKIKTAFATPWGSFQFKRMPFGLSGGPSTYARLVQLVLRGIPYSMALPYLDDTIVHSPPLDHHFDALRRVLQAHRKAGLKLQPDKCQLFQPQIEYLGHLVTGDGIRPMDHYVSCLLYTSDAADE